jgi:hypothetical protein
VGRTTRANGGNGKPVLTCSSLPEKSGTPSTRRLRCPESSVTNAVVSGPGFRTALPTELAVVAEQGDAVARWKMAVAHTANSEPDGAARSLRARKGGRFRHEPRRILHLRACGTAAARVERTPVGSKGDPTRPKGYTATLSLIPSFGA